MKLADARKDHYRRLAHEQGFRARSAFKLKELNQSYRLIGPGFYVLDLGCAPGGWTQVAVKLVGNQGKVMGLIYHMLKKFKVLILFEIILRMNI